VLISPDEGLKLFKEVFARERREIAERRKRVQNDGKFEGDVEPCSPENLVGLALSGGGIRSATFCLGLLQGLNELHLLRVLDYLSTVSGGGFVGGWWSAWLSREKRESGEVFPPDERIEPVRSDDDYLTVEAAVSESPPTGDVDHRPVELKTRIAESSINAGKDPIHHLRLFANYLTPRRGALSLDTWRAVTFVSRNLVLTWLVLLPILVAAALLGQLYFVVGSPFDFPHKSLQAAQEESASKGAPAQAASDRAPEPQSARDIADKQINDLAHSFFHKTSDAETLKNRAWVAVWPIGGLGLAIFLVALCWTIRIQSGPSFVALLRIVVFLFVLVIAFARDLVLLLVLVSILLLPSILLVLALIKLRRIIKSEVLAQLRSSGRVRERLKGTLERLWSELRSKVEQRQEAKLQRRAERQWRKEVYLNKMTRWHARMLVVLVVVTAVLTLSGFGHEFVEYVFYQGPADTPFKAFLHYLAKSVSLSALFAAIAGMIYTGSKAAPTGGGDQREAAKPSATSRLIFAITPPLALVVLGVIAAWFAHALLWFTFANPQIVDGLTYVTLTGIYFAFISAAWEMEWRRIRPWIGWTLLAILLMFVGIVVIRLIPLGPAGDSWADLPRRLWTLTIIGLVGSLAGFKLFVGKMMDRESLKKPEGYKVKFYVLVTAGLISLVSLAVGLAFLTDLMLGSPSQNIPDKSLLESAVKALSRCGVLYLFIVFEQVFGRRRNERSYWLVTNLYVVVTTLLIMSFYPDPKLHPTIALAHAVVLLTTTTLAFVTTLGWMADPNALSMHSFYKGRLTRAYLGASNENRGQGENEITESVAGDDILLTNLQNCRQGAPYHLINTTLNLVGGRDLATAQRSSAMFVLSKYYCGSLRTGYRETKDYMHSEFSLGTAVAVSGAAVSPNMGSVKTTASLAMLMTLLNVRLGYWAPTPNKGRWSSAQARLWPYYTLREFLSETNDLSSYCYLTDGGHFDNTGLYSLVERGCRCIVVADCSADPEPCFADLGNAIRRCRIDFDAEICLDLTPFVRQKKDEFARQHYVVGQVIYSETHRAKLGWPAGSDGTGIIIHIKPALLADDKGLAADVRQYGIEHSIFPQQTTANQWFDEAQFESYRKLGYHSAAIAFANVKAYESEAYKKALEKQQGDQSIPTGDELAFEKKERERITDHKFSADEVLELFKFLYDRRPS
jgi:hypothetical protein